MGGRYFVSTNQKASDFSSTRNNTSAWMLLGGAGNLMPKVAIIVCLNVQTCCVHG